MRHQPLGDEQRRPKGDHFSEEMQSRVGLDAANDRKHATDPRYGRRHKE
jgi:hypothetical protein